jgi:hypothetical protein
VDLLREEYPGLVPVRGGQDSGMDGALPSKGGALLPLLCTSAKDGLANLKRSLQSYLKSGGPAREAVFATSRPLSKRRRDNLDAAAQLFGFRLRNIHDQADLAQRLYRHPEWCQSLLGLTGSLPPLSILPSTHRPQVRVPLVGREEDLGWLSEQSGDSLVVGQPGSGKTYLHQAVSADGEFLFVASDDATMIAAGLRAQQPRGVIVDDAHLALPTLRALRRLRTEMGANFQILANCWPGEQDLVARELDLPAGAIRELPLLTRDQMVAVVHNCDIGGPAYLVQEIINQADGRPGLAVTLCHLCLRGEVKSLQLGDALARDVRTTFGSLVGNDVIPLLGVLALGGRHGMMLDSVAEALRIPLPQASALVAKLAAGGVVHQIEQSRLAVLPEALRHALVRDVFFIDPGRLSLDTFLPLTSDLEATIRTLVGARHRGAPIDDDRLLALIEKARCWESLVEFAWLGPEAYRAALARHPEQRSALADPGLQLAPDETIAGLLEAATGDSREPTQVIEHPMRKLNDWVQSAPPGTGAAVDRRRHLLATARWWMTEGGDRDIGMRALATTLCPSFHVMESAPGSGMKVMWSSSSITAEEASEVSGFWPEILEELRANTTVDWKPIRDVLHDWLHPSHVSPRVQPGVEEVLAPAGRRMLEDVLPLLGDDAALRRWARVEGANLEPPIEVDIDRDFETLFPIERLDGWEECQRAWQADVAALVERWSRLDPLDVGRRLASIEAAAGRAEIRWPDLRCDAARQLAACCPRPSDWATALIEAGCSAETVQPFLALATQATPPDWGPVAWCLEAERYAAAAGDVALSAADPPAQHLQRALEIARSMPGWIEVGCLQRRFPIATVRSLLQHDERSVQAAATLGECCGSGGVREGLREEWRAAFVRSIAGDAHVDDILRANAPLAYEWLEARIREASPDLWKAKRAVHAAAETISKEQRTALIDLLPTDRSIAMAVQPLVGNDPTVYSRLLSRESLRAFHLRPLRGPPDAAWIAKAIVALGHGYRAREIGRSVYGDGQSWTGPESAMWQGWADSFGALLDHADPRIQEIGRIEKECAELQRDRAKRQEHFEDVHGRR